MIYVDYRQGSHELVAPLKKMGLPVEETTLESADLMWEGRGEKGAPVLIGVEHKKLSELVQALRTGRLVGHQLLKMQQYDFRYLLIEGEVTYGTSGILTQKNRYRSGLSRPIPGKMGISEFLQRLHVLHLRGGVYSLFARTPTDTYQSIAALYRVWTDRALDEHQSHIAIYRPPSLVPISEFRIFMQSIDGISFKTSKAIENAFSRGGRSSIREAVNAPMSEWLKIEGVGTKLARHITEVFGK